MLRKLIILLLAILSVQIGILEGKQSDFLRLENESARVAELGKADELLGITKYDQKFLDYIKQFDNTVNNPTNRTKVWRVMRKDQSVTEAIVPKSSTGLTTKNTPYTIAGHVKNGSKSNTVTPYISSFADKNKALQRALDDGNLKVVEIDLTKVDGKYFDLSIEKIRNTHLQGNTARNFAESSSEFLIVTDQIPSSAYKVIQ